ncbi:MAG: peptide ABC transporter substrate-binding protein [Oribacterium sp.]|jgi:oligopeptide transport system substrate-binding protein|nr:peptide ABC transporter substrate-binding protein [Oribacterium sp.]
MRKTKAILAAVTAGSMVFGLAACGGGSSAYQTTTAAAAAETTAAAAADTAAAGGAETTAAAEASGEASTEDLKIMMETPVESLDPQQATDGTSFEVIADYTDGLMQMDADGKAVNAIAESYETSDDGLTWTFHLRQDAKWSNGTPVTAKDFVFGWQRAVDPDVASEYAYMLSDIGQVKNAQDIIDGKKDKSELGVTAVDDYTLKVELNAPVSYFLSLMYFPTYYPVNEEFFNTCADTFGTSPETTLSNGAFVLDQYEPAATEFHLTKNPDYYDADKVSLTGLDYQVIQDSQQALMSFQNGELDMTLVNGDQVDQVKDDPAFKSIGAGYLWYVSPNMAKVPELANDNIRKALTFAIDRTAITEDVLKDGCKPTFTAVPPEFAAGPDGSDFSADQEKFKDVCDSDAAKAAEYWQKGLEELGETGFELEMVVDADDAPQKVATVLQEQWQTTLPGLTVTLKVEPKKQRVQDMQDGNYQLGLTRWGPDYADPMTYLGMWVTNNSNNYGLWSNADYDAIIAECTTGDLATDAQGRWNKLYDAEQLVMNESVIFPLYTQCNAEMISTKVSGVEFHPVALNRVYKNAKKSA